MKFKLQAKSGAVMIDITDLIGLGGYYATDLRASLSAQKNVSAITVRLSSDGGDILEGLAIYNMLKAHPAKVRIEVLGVAASMGSLIAMAGDEIAMSENSFMMIHNPSAGAKGESSDLRETADLLDKSRDMLAGIYATRTGQDLKAVKAAMAAETWMTASEALAAGYATEIIPAKNMVAVYRRFEKTPKALLRAKPKAKAVDELSEIAKALGLADDADLETIKAAIAALQDAAAEPDADDKPADEDTEKPAATDDKPADDKPPASDDDAKAQARRIIAQRGNERLARIEARLDSDARERLIASNPKKFTLATEKLARKWPLDTLREFVRDAPDVGEEPATQLTAKRRGAAALTEEITLTNEERQICKLTGKDPKVLLDFKKAQAEKRKAG